jgi:EAL domain-containing protein (putative c-di-GMP-specific phosphodiesterase class I)
VELFDPVADQVVTPGDLALEQQLRSSVADGQLRAFYQPIVSLADRSVQGYEALLRWAHSDQGLLLPERFLSVAESTGLIRPIGNWMLTQATRDASHSMPAHAWIGVNASPIQLARGGFVDSVVRALAASGLPPARLHLEVTESTLLQASPAVMEDVNALAATGVSIVLDDFGTGYSSLSLLRDLPVRVVKIDRSFVAPILTDPGALAIVRAVLGMCRDMGLETVAEGVEKEEQADTLAALGCTHGQGWLFGRPVSLTEIGEAGGT